MAERPVLKEELVDFCRKNGLPVSGGKIDITNRIIHYLDTGEVESVLTPKKTTTVPSHIDEEMAIEAGFVCTEKHRAFFKDKIGNSFSFSVPFQKSGHNRYEKSDIAAIER